MPNLPDNTPAEDDEGRSKKSAAKRSSKSKSKSPGKKQTQYVEEDD